MNHKRIIVVLGMHRSGTSALTRGLEVLGIGLGAHLNPANFANPKGYWEDEDVMALNEALLGRLGSAYDGLALISPDSLRGDDYADLRAQARLLLERKLEGASIWAFKDPRTARLLPFWQKVFADLGLQQAYVISVRHPISVAQSLARRDGFAPVKSYYLWLEHLLGALLETGGYPRVVVDYDALLSRPEVEIGRIADALRLAQPLKAELDVYAHEFLDQDLRHTRYSEADLATDVDMPPCVVRLYALLQRLAGHGQPVAESELEHTLAETMTQWRSQLPLLRHMSRLDADIVELRQTSQLQNDELGGLRSQILALDEERNNVRQTIEAYQRDISAYEKQAAQFVAEIHDDHRRLTLRDEEIAKLSAAAAHAAQEKENLLRSTQALQESMRTLHSEHRVAVQQLQEIKASRSWSIGRMIARLGPNKAPGGASLEQQGDSNVWASRPGLPPDFDAALYAELNPDVIEAGVNPVIHYLEFGIAEQRPYKRAAEQDKALEPELTVDDGEFDADYYLANNPDVASAGLNPYQHYLNHGKSEGRLGRALRIDNRSAFDRLDPAKDTILLVGHEASRTGAPVLTLNIARSMVAKYNVIVMLLGPGALAQDMTDAGAIVIGPFPSLRGDPAQAAPIMEAVMQACRIKFALTNSIVAAAVLPELARRGIPTVALIHEFASYTRPRDAFLNVALWANALVFSTRLTMESATAEAPVISSRPIGILPQGRCTLPGIDMEDALESSGAIELKRRIRGDADTEDTVVVLGLGTVQLRKGVDLFIACAERIVRQDPQTRYRFVWIGGGFDPDGDLHYSVYLADQIRRSGLTDRLTILPETAYIEAAYTSADVLVLSSRLDPLPNVGIDAMHHGLPVVCFDDTTGIADVLREAGLADQCVAPYLDIDAMAAKITALARSRTDRARLAERMREVADTRFSMETYVDELESLALMHAEEAAHECRTAQALAESGLLDRTFMLPPDLLSLDDAEAAAFYVRTWTTGIRRRKPFPGFHPGIYRDLNPALPAGKDPFLHYVENARPAGPWLFDVITDRDEIAPDAPPTRVALHLHVYYVDLLEEVLGCLRQNQTRPDLFVSVPSQAVAAQAAAALAAYPGRIVRIAVVPNRGRDVGPFLTEFGQELVSGYDIVGHMHTKKTTALSDRSVGRLWFSFLLANMLGGRTAMADRIIGRMANDASIGMVFPDDPNVCGWDANLPYAQPIADRLQLGTLPAELNFPVGTMFWARAGALRPFVELGLDWDSYPCEPLGYDGSILHALERLFALVITRSGLRTLVAYCAGTGR